MKIALLSAALLLAPFQAGAALTTGATCRTLKLKIAAKGASAVLKCWAKAAGKDMTLQPDAACVAKAEARLQDAFLKAEAPGLCPTTGDAPSVLAYIDTLVAAVVQEVSPASPPSKCLQSVLLAPGKYLAKLTKALSTHLVRADENRLAASTRKGLNAFVVALGKIKTRAVKGGESSCVEADMPLFNAVHTFLESVSGEPVTIYSAAEWALMDQLQAQTLAVWNDTLAQMGDNAEAWDAAARQIQAMPGVASAQVQGRSVEVAFTLGVNLTLLAPSGVAPTDPGSAFGAFFASAGWAEARAADVAPRSISIWNPFPTQFGAFNGRKWSDALTQACPPYASQPDPCDGGVCTPESFTTAMGSDVVWIITHGTLIALATGVEKSDAVKERYASALSLGRSGWMPLGGKEYLTVRASYLDGLRSLRGKLVINEACWTGDPSSPVRLKFRDKGATYVGVDGLASENQRAPKFDGLLAAVKSGKSVSEAFGSDPTLGETFRCAGECNLVVEPGATGSYFCSGLSVCSSGTCETATQCGSVLCDDAMQFCDMSTATCMPLNGATPMQGEWRGTLTVTGNSTCVFRSTATQSLVMRLDSGGSGTIQTAGLAPSNTTWVQDSPTTLHWTLNGDNCLRYDGAVVGGRMTGHATFSAGATVPTCACSAGNTSYLTFDMQKQ